MSHLLPFLPNYVLIFFNFIFVSSPPLQVFPSSFLHTTSKSHLQFLPIQFRLRRSVSARQEGLKKINDHKMLWIITYDSDYGDDHDCQPAWVQIKFFCFKIYLTPRIRKAGQEGVSEHYRSRRESPHCSRYRASHACAAQK